MIFEMDLFNMILNSIRFQELVGEGQRKKYISALATVTQNLWIKYGN